MSGTGPSDSELLADWLDGHRESAFHALVERYAGLVHMAAKRTCGDDSLAAEASQLTFIALARKARGLSGRATLAGWLHVTAILQARNLLRQRKREIRKLHILRTHMENQPQASPAAEWQRIQPVLDEALAALSSKDRETLLLRFYRSLSVREIGAALGIATDAAQKRLDRATEKLRNQLARRGYQVGGSLGAVMLAGFASDAQAAVPSTSLLASNALAVAGSSGTATLTTIGIIAMTKKTAITAGVVVLLAGAGTIALINGNKDDNSSSAKGHAGGNTAPASSSASNFTPVESAAARGDRAKPRDPAANPDFIAKYGEARTNLSKHIATNLISLLEDAVSMGEMAVSGQMGNAFGGPRNGLRMGLGGRLNDDLKLTDEQQEKAGEIYKEYQKRELAKSKESIEKLKKDPQALMQLMLASDAHSRGEIPQEEYDQIQASIADDLKTTINPLDRENFRGGQPMKDTAFTSEFQAILDPDQSATFAAAATEQQSKAAEDRSINNLPSMELEKMDQTVTSAKKLTTGLKSMMEGMGGLQDLGPMMEERRRSREAQRGAQQEAAPESTTPPAGE